MLDKAILQRLAVREDVTDHVRIIGREHADTPLGMGFGRMCTAVRKPSSGAPAFVPARAA